MNLPTPQVPEQAPHWENYIIAQTVQASLGQIPEHALALGVEVDGAHLILHLRISEVTDEDRLDMDDIVSELDAFVENVDIDVSYQEQDQLRVDPADGVCWVWLARPVD